MELQALHSVAPHGALAKFAVLGSGPLPLTSLCIFDGLQYQKYGPACIHNVDHDPLAIAQSSKLCHALGHTEKTICFRCADAQADTVELCHFDVVYLAALAGICCEQKHDIITSVVKRMRPGALLVLRTAHSLRGLLYPVGPWKMTSSLVRIPAKSQYR
jgi:nicotianamine synthase